jgi:small subunit ribosomal protein S13
MLNVLGVNLPGNKSVRIALNRLYGIGNKTSQIICDKLHINPQYRINQLTDLQLNYLIKEIKNYTINIDLRKKIKANIDKLIKIRSYRGLRHSYGLPVRGQRTRSNGRTQKYLSKKLVKNLKVKKFKKPYKIKEVRKPKKKKRNK